MRTVVAALLALLLAAAGEPTALLAGENVCSRLELQSKQVNTTFLESVRVKKHRVCLTPPFVCADWVNQLETRWRLENVTREVSVSHCCPGYTRQQAGCLPHCPAGCGEGECVAPGRCGCPAGWSGETCGVAGCPPGSWGANCNNLCTCARGGQCDSVSGSCHCGPGFTG